MKNKILIFITLIGLIGFMSSCEKDGTRIEMSTNVTAPSIVSIPDLTLDRSNSTETLEFVGTPVDPGFNASANYYLEAGVPGTDFDESVVVYSGVQVESIKLTVSEINGALLDILTEDAESPVEFRIRCQLVVDGGTGAPGTDEPFEYISATVDDFATVFGFLKLELIGSGMDQKVVSPLSNGEYSGFVKLNTANAFTLYDADGDITYGGAGGTLSVGGAAIVPAADGWYKLTVDVTGSTYDDAPNMIGLVGSATPNNWDSPDQKMEYDPATKSWSITLDLTAEYMKFRMNDGWSWNLGLADGSTTDLVFNGPDIPVAEAGNYTVTLFVSDYDGMIGTFTMVKN